MPTEEVPIGSVTNGVHAPTWISPELDDLLTRRVLPEWDGAGIGLGSASTRPGTTSCGGRSSRDGSGW